jgi:hypothetical protein
MVQKVAWQEQAVWMRFASMFKHEWTIDDYPVRVWFKQPIEPTTPSRRKSIPWFADVANSPAISGSGNTRQEALEEVRKSFNRFVATKRRLPRPGTEVPIEFAASHRVSQHSALDSCSSRLRSQLSIPPTTALLLRALAVFMPNAVLHSASKTGRFASSVANFTTFWSSGWFVRKPKFFLGPRECSQAISRKKGCCKDALR